MKKVFKILLVTLFLSAGASMTNEVKSQAANVSFSVFYSSLKPYGRWVNHPKYGQVWISNTRGFSPYETGGHWAYTDYGWTWVSDYDWGWAPFHYGRWAHESNYGWYWVPDYEWAPAWVAWRGGGDYYGWAPLSPGLSIGVDLSFGNQIPYDRWVFAPHRYITSPYIARYYVPRSRNTVIIKNTTIVNNVTVKNNVHYVGGPRKDEVERVNHTRIQTLTVANSSRPGKTVVNNNTVNVYRPVINNNDKTVVNKNSNNTTTVNKNSNNTTKNSNNTTANKNSNNTTNKNSNNTTTGKSNPTASKSSNTGVTKNNNTTNNTKSNTTAHKNGTNTTQKKQPTDQTKQPTDQTKQPADQKPPVKKNTEAQQPPTSSNTNNMKHKSTATYQHPDATRSKATDVSKEKKQQAAPKQQADQQKVNDKKHKPENNPPK